MTATAPFVQIMAMQRKRVFRWLRRLAMLVALPLSCDPAVAQQVVSGMILPDGQVVSGPVFRRNGTSVPSVTNGAEANAYGGFTAPTLSFLPGGPAAVVLTSAPSLYVRAYTSGGVADPVGRFIAPANTLRGLNGAQVRDVLARPFARDSLVFVKVPAGTCVMYGTAGPIMGNFPAGPGIPTPGPWGNGGALQGLVIGTTSDPNCRNPEFVPIANYFNGQFIGNGALAYRPNAGKGNTYVVAAALDVGAFPAQFSDMDTVYNSLDLLNYGSAGSLPVALKQLGGESYADFGYLGMMAGRVFLNVMHQQMRGARIAPATSTTSTLSQSAEAPLNLTEPPAAPTEMATDLKRQTASPGERRTDTGGVWFSPYGAV